MAQKDNPLTIEEYSSELTKTLNSIDKNKINKLAQRLKKSISKNQKIIIMGNGGSAANAIHIAGDYMKTFGMIGYKPNISTPSDNICFLTAVSNDLNFNDAFQLYLESVIDENSIIIFLSGSGNSINLIKSLNSNLLKKVSNIETWSLSAYEGGRISKLTNNWIHLPTRNMEIAEDLHLIIFHYIKQKLYFQFINSDKNKKSFNDERYFKRTMLNEVS